MSVIDLIARVDAICRRYEKYDLDNNEQALASQCDVVEAGVEASLTVATKKGDSAFDVTMRPDICQTKAHLLEEASKLQRLALEKASVLSKDELEAQNNLVSLLKERIELIPHGIEREANQSGGWATSASHRGTKIGSTSDKRFGSADFQQTEESDQFRQECEIQKMKQVNRAKCDIQNRRTSNSLSSRTPTSQLVKK